MNQITDMHCHILPGLDDGSKRMEETMEALREASRQQPGWQQMDLRRKAKKI